MREIHEFALNLAQEAGKIPLKYFRGDFDTITKDDGSPVTNADRETEEFIRAAIGKRFPDDGIIGEEFGETAGKSGRTWILDPIDGTKAFVRGLPLFGTMIAVVENGVAHSGVIHYPALGQTLSGLRGEGAWIGGEPCRVSDRPGLEGAFLTTSYPNKVMERWGKEFTTRLIEQSHFLGTYDCYGYLLVASGRFDALFEPSMKLWDLAPLFPVFESAGAVVTTERGETGLEIDHMVIANPQLHQKILALMNGG